MRLKSIDEVSIIKLVDGSLFPTLSSMYWATYKKHKNAVRLHLEMDLNTMTPTEFLVQKANSSERSFLLSILQKGYTYIADRGYFGFKVGNAIIRAKAFFVIKIRANLLFTILEELPVTNYSNTMPKRFEHTTGQIVQFNNDEHEHKYRVIGFHVL